MKLHRLNNATFIATIFLITRNDHEKLTAFCSDHNCFKAGLPVPISCKFEELQKSNILFISSIRLAVRAEVTGSSFSQLLMAQAVRWLKICAASFTRILAAQVGLMWSAVSCGAFLMVLAFSNWYKETTSSHELIVPSSCCKYKLRNLIFNQVFKLAVLKITKHELEGTKIQSGVSKIFPLGGGDNFSDATIIWKSVLFNSINEKTQVLCSRKILSHPTDLSKVLLKVNYTGLGCSFYIKIWFGRPSNRFHIALLRTNIFRPKYIGSQ